MHIAVYLGSSLGKDSTIQEATKALGTWIGKEGHTLVYGGGQTGLIGIVADACLDEKGKVIGVIPTFLEKKEITHHSLTDLHVVDTMAERKTMMIEYSQAFVAIPGGVGTLEEISEIMSLLHLNRLQAPCVFYNPDHFYDPMHQLLENMADEGFFDPAFLEKVHFCSTIEKVEDVLTSYAKEHYYG